MSDLTLHILRSAIILLTVLCYTIAICFVIARSESRLAALLPLPLLGVLFTTARDGRRNTIDTRWAPIPRRDSWGTATGDTADSGSPLSGAGFAKKMGGVGGGGIKKASRRSASLDARREV